jgi:hypothetical protein
MMPDSCGCCQPGSPPVVATVENRPALSAIAYRIGTFASFRRAMLAAIPLRPEFSEIEVLLEPDRSVERLRASELTKLRTRSSDDYAITVLELWAAVADVLTFYQERFANEAYLRTAVQRDSVMRLARLLDYQLRPGAAATTLLAFTLQPNARLTLPAELRAQSVPGPGELPQKFETLEGVVADARLNRLRVLPRPVVANPLAAGATESSLAPGAAGLDAAARLAPGDRVLLYTEGSSAAIEELRVQRLLTDGDLVKVEWMSPVSGLVGTSWSATTSAFKAGRTLRLFGYNAPPDYVEAQRDSTSPGGFKSVLRSTTFAYDPRDPGDPTQDLLYLDRRYEDLKPGVELLVSEHLAAGLKNTRMRVTAVAMEESKVGPFTDRVTRLTVRPVTGALANSIDVRTALVHELDGAPLSFWDMAFPSAFTSPTVFVPGRRVGWNVIEVGRTIAGNRFKPGTRILATDIELGRRVLVADAIGVAVPARIVRPSLAGTTITFDPTVADALTARELGLSSDAAERVTALVSAWLADPFREPTNSRMELAITIGQIGPRVVSLADVAMSGSTPGQRTIMLDDLQNKLMAKLTAADTEPEFQRAVVLRLGNRLAVVPGIPEANVAIGPSDADPTTVKELGLSEDRAQIVDGLRSAPVNLTVSLSRDPATVAVTIGAVGPKTLTWNSAPTIGVALQALPGMLHTVGAGTRSFDNAHVPPIMDNRVYIFSGIAGEQREELLALGLTTDGPLDLDVATAELLGNVAFASHGETVRREVLGDGNAPVPFQRFSLQKQPLTFVPGSGPGGLISSLRVLVDDALWRNVPTLYGTGPRDRVHLTRLESDGGTTIRFGDGKTGARPMTGRGNIIAKYRVGLGLAGRVPANAIRTLLDRPTGLRGVTNPSPTDGGADPESLDHARGNAPTTVRTFGRAVSLRDFEDIAAAAGEVAKASATWVWTGDWRAVHLTVAAQGGTGFSVGALRRVHSSLAGRRDPNHPLFVDNFVRVPVVVTATLRVDEVHLAQTVAAEARLALLRALSFEELGFGQSLHLSDVYRVLQAVEGVESVDVDRFQFKNQSADFLAARNATTAPVQGHLLIYPARTGGSVGAPVVPAEQGWIEIPTQDVTLTTSGGLSV